MQKIDKDETILAAKPNIYKANHFGNILLSFGAMYGAHKLPSNIIPDPAKKIILGTATLYAGYNLWLYKQNLYAPENELKKAIWVLEKAKEAKDMPLIFAKEPTRFEQVQTTMYNLAHYK